jgi:hypothetical protein
MSRPAPFTQADVKRAVKGAVAAGINVARVEVDKHGKIVVIAGKPGEDAPTDLDMWLGKHHARPS